ncbi:DUF2497 domain-containing protein [Polycladidibacter hongkongensis]|uniref:DUF2497 domain-containing protein n=1 Tax=Polycladidibacter hongkongensis TaxID=1647556 RepID=UPI000A82DEC9|nr:DUF2497 domain-containing protein [Pseudovibrio hongkongensis]
MEAAAKTQEPSMEEILSSIRKIISEDDKPAEAAADAEPTSDAPGAAMENKELSQNELDQLFDDAPAASDRVDTPEAMSEALQDDAEDVLELTEKDRLAADMEKSVPEIVEGLSVDLDAPSGDVVFDQLAEAKADAAQDSLGVDGSAAEALKSMMGEMAGATHAQAEEQLLSEATNSAVASAFGGLATTVLSNNARTLEDLVQEMLRPMLKQWLDAQLPGMVERLVRQEIERISRSK